MQRVKHLLAQRPSYLIWIGVMALLVVLTLFAPLLPLHPNVVDVANMSQGPTLQHWFGTDDLGRDYLARVIYGGRVSLMVGFFVNGCVGCIRHIGWYNRRLLWWMD
nr:hypothetical protein [Weissella confusa]